MIFRDFPWFSMIFRDFHDFPWLSVTLRDSPWLFVTPPGESPKINNVSLKMRAWLFVTTFFSFFRDFSWRRFGPHLAADLAPQGPTFFSFFHDFFVTCRYFSWFFVNFRDFPWFFVTFRDFPWLSVIMLLNPVVAPSMLAHWPWRRSWRGERGKGGRERCKFLFYGCGAENVF